MSSEDKTESSESILLNPEDETLDDVESFPYPKILKDSNKRKRGKNIEYKLPEFFENFKQMEIKIKNGEINGNYWELKSNQNGVQRYYCRFIEHGCRAALYLEDIGDNKCKFKESEQSHSNHPEQISPKKKIFMKRSRCYEKNPNNWKLSTCTCWYWLKNYYCCHTIACSYRLKLMNFNDIGMDIPLNNKLRKGAKKKKSSIRNRTTRLYTRTKKYEFTIR
ncbi:unnamed protein product [Brachionus calyciflorus]|uniref:SWIM-type domain-containing protein n=1 Tax=Brachionus calyciflorus TaxID=104777 RepID=A0A814E8E7_9BILA|nr:unnamed protein product [Brachionus calyciflorus]